MTKKMSCIRELKSGVLALQSSEAVAVVKQTAQRSSEAIEAATAKVAWGTPNYIQVTMSTDTSMWTKAKAYFSTSTAHGINRIFEDGNLGGRILFWFLVWTAGLVVTICWMIPGYVGYLNREVSTTVVINRNHEREGRTFPVLTLCPHGSGLRCDCHLWKALACEGEAFEEHFSRYLCAGYGNTWTHSDCNRSSFESVEDPCGAEPGAKNYTTLLAEVKERFEENEDAAPYLYLGEMTQYGRKTLKNSIFHMSVDGVDVCGEVHAGYSCETEPSFNFDVPMITHGSAYVYCTQILVPAKYLQSAPYASAIELTLYDHDDKIFTPSSYSLTEATHATGSLDVGLSTAPSDARAETFRIANSGWTTVIGAGVTQTNQMPGYGDSHCSRVTDGTSYHSCQLSCEAKAFAIKCGECALADQALSGIDALAFCPDLWSKPMRECQTKLSTLVDQSDPVVVDYNALITNCISDTCDLPCLIERVKYDSVGTSIMTSVQVAAYGRQLNDTDRAASLKAYKFLEIHAGWTDFTGLTIREDPKYALFNLLGSTGGFLGLWCGISMMTIVEILEFLFFVGVAQKASWNKAARSASSEQRQRNGGEGDELTNDGGAQVGDVEMTAV